MNIVNIFRKRIKLLFLIYIIIVFILSIAPINNSSSELNDIYIINIRFDYMIHFLMFIPFLILARLIKELNFSKSKTDVLYWLLYGLGFAATSEIIQKILPYRTYNINDLIANVIGLLLGGLVYLYKPKVQLF